MLEEYPFPSLVGWNIFSIIHGLQFYTSTLLVTSLIVSFFSWKYFLHSCFFLVHILFYGIFLYIGVTDFKFLQAFVFLKYVAALCQTVLTLSITTILGTHLLTTLSF